MTKKEAKSFLNVCKNSSIIKFNEIVKRNNVSLSAVSRFINSDLYDDMISLKKLELICDDLYNTCGCITDLYKEIVLHENVA